ncbi:MAG: hypothetical protein ACK4FE_04920, partial [Azonexus sp.]
NDSEPPLAKVGQRQTPNPLHPSCQKQRGVYTFQEPKNNNRKTRQKLVTGYLKLWIAVPS